MALSDLSTSQRYLLGRVSREPGLLVENRSTAAASLVRKGFVLKVLSRQRAPEGASRRHGDQQPMRGQLAELTLTEAGRVWLAAHPDPSQGDAT